MEALQVILMLELLQNQKMSEKLALKLAERYVEGINKDRDPVKDFTKMGMTKKEAESVTAFLDEKITKLFLDTLEVPNV